MPVYWTVTQVVHAATGKPIAPGEAIDLSHCTEKQIGNLLEQGAIRKVEDKFEPVERVVRSKPARKSATHKTTKKLTEE